MRCFDLTSAKAMEVQTEDSTEDFACGLTGPCLFLLAFSCSAKLPAKEMMPPTVGWALLSSLVIKMLLSGDSRLYQVDS